MKKTHHFSVVLTILFALAITSVGLSQDKITKSFNVKKGENLSVKVSGDVRVASWNKDEVYVEVTGLDKDDSEDLKMKQEGNSVSVVLKNRDGASFSIKTPEQFNLDVKTSGGDLLCYWKIRWKCYRNYGRRRCDGSKCRWRRCANNCRW